MLIIDERINMSGNDEMNLIEFDKKMSWKNRKDKRLW